MWKGLGGDESSAAGSLLGYWHVFDCIGQAAKDPDTPDARESISEEESEAGLKSNVEVPSRDEVKSAIRGLSPTILHAGELARNLLHYFGHVHGWEDDDSLWAHKCCVVLAYGGEAAADDLAFELHCLGHCYEEQGKHARAREYFLRSRQLLIALFGEEHHLVPELNRHIDDRS